MTNEVTIEEVGKLGIDVELETMEVKQWTKGIALTYRGRTYQVDLHWHYELGYQLDFDDELPKRIEDLSQRPEFEYVLDSITHEQEKAEANV